ncbi:MAG: HD domain-containing protein [Treponema sp.]|nr:HD domain-containing protein [Treponema sp.]
MAERKIDLKSIIKLDSEINKIQDLDLLLERILLEARKVVSADAGSIYVRQAVEENGVIVDRLQFRYPQNDTIQKTMPPGQKMIYSIFSMPINEKSIAGYCACTEKMVNVPDMYNIPADAPYSFNSTFDMITGYKTVSSLTFPLITADNRLLGVIQVLNKIDEQGKFIPFTQDDEFLLAHFAVNATIALERAYVTRAMILRMIKMAELRDPKETGAHVNRVAGYAVEIYDRWAANHKISQKEHESFRDMLKISSMLHDVGKVAISDTILKKPARFTPEEFQVMQHHTLYGAGLFEDLQSPIDLLAKDIALTHHENWDGSGYPGYVNPVNHVPDQTDEAGKPVGRKGEEIPFAGRIVAIADVFDALCSKRVYKEAWSEEEVLTEIRQLAGTKFDPELVDIFFDILPNIKQTQSLYPEP